MVRLLLIRHAPAETGPPPGRLCGTLDVPLSADGKRLLDAFCARLEGSSRPDAIYSSTLQRARAVAVALQRVWDIPPLFDEALREIDCGELEGMPIEELQRSHARLWTRNLAQDDDEFQWPGGESYRGFRERVIGGLARIAAEHPGGTVAVVTHAGVIAQVLGVLHGRPAAVWDRDRPAPLSQTEVLWADGAPLRVVSVSLPG